MTAVATTTGKPPTKAPGKADGQTRERTPWERLRAPFPPEKVGKLPRATVDRDKYKALPKARCGECGGWHPSSSTIHLDFVGHADVTDRLLEVDPQWNWEPLAYDESKLPKFVVVNGRPVGLWIKLTVCAVTRLGYGSCEPTKGDAEKELIGDALRNGAMRFGVGLDLWRKERPHVEEEDSSQRREENDDKPRVTGQTKMSTGEQARILRLNEQLPVPMTGLPCQAFLEHLPYDKALAQMTAKHEAQCGRGADGNGCAHVKGEA